MKIKDVRDKKDLQLKEELLKLRKESLNMRFQSAQGQLKNTSRVSVVRKNIARIKTVLNEREITKGAN